LNIFECPDAGGSRLGKVLTLDASGFSTFESNGTPAFGNVALNDGATLPIDLTPDTGYSVELASGSALNSPFGFDFGTCATAGAVACTADETFSPDSLVTSQGDINVFERPDIGGSCLAATYQVSGTGVTAAEALPEPFTLSLFGVGLASAAAMRRRKKPQKA
jgi:hypothetical protein